MTNFDKDSYWLMCEPVCNSKLVTAKRKVVPCS
jgi:hypothetical protein